MNTPITVSSLIREVRKLAKESPDNVYQTDGLCMYDAGLCTNGSVGCIFGQALRKYGYFVDKDYASYQNNISISLLLRRELYLSGTAQEIAWCSRVQILQDVNTPWKEAIQTADEEYPLD